MKLQNPTDKPVQPQTRLRSAARSLAKPFSGSPGPAPINGRSWLTAQNLTFAYNGKPVLRDVDIELEPGCMVGVIGPNGAGKSTLVRLLGRLLDPAEGSVSLNGRDLAQWKPGELARVLAVVPQDPDLPGGYSAWEMVLMGRTPYLNWLGHESEQDRLIARQAMQETGTWELAQRLIGQLSGGEQQRVVIARTLAQEPQILLLDEPTAHLDINHQVETLTLITRLVRERHLAALGIFHDLNLAAQYCHRLLLLNQGQVVAQGTPAEVLTPSILHHAYGADVAVMPHPQNGLPVVCPVCSPPCSSSN